MNPLELLKFYTEAGIDEALEETPQNRLLAVPTPPQTAPKPALNQPEPSAMPPRPKTTASLPSAVIQARELADNAKTLAELEQTVREFNGCPLKKTANKTVFCRGNPESKLMLIGEAPGANEDVEGIPFCGQSGQLLDNMLRSIGYDNSNAYITNTTFWRPPGNRKPTPEELEVCKPFVEKHIALLNPKLLVLVGGVAIADMLNTTESVGKLRLKFHDYQNQYLKKPIKVLCTFHPSYLLRSPGQKAFAWKDWLMVKRFILAD
jgi:DNA polymerase